MDFEVVVDQLAGLENQSPLPAPQTFIQHTFASHCDTLPSSWPEIMYLAKGLNPATVTFGNSSQMIFSEGSLVCSASGSGLISYTHIVLSCPWRFSVTPSNCLPSSENSNLLIAVANSHVFKSLPVLTSHNLIVLSAPPVARSTVLGSTSTVQRAPW